MRTEFAELTVSEIYQLIAEEENTDVKEIQGHKIAITQVAGPALYLIGIYGGNEYWFELGFMQGCDGDDANRWFCSRAEKSKPTIIDIDDFAFCNNRNAYLAGAWFAGSDLRGADFEKANLYRATFEEADLTLSTFEGANLRDANLHGANLTNANLRDANLTGANLRDANLTGADFDGATLDGIIL